MLNENRVKLMTRMAAYEEKKGKEVDATAGITFESSENEIKKDDLIQKILAVIVLICMFSLIKPIIKRKIEAKS